LNILNTGLVCLNVVKEQYSEESGKTSCQKLDIGGLGQTDQVEEVSLAKKTELIAEGSGDGFLVGGSRVKFSETRDDRISIVA